MSMHAIERSLSATIRAVQIHIASWGSTLERSNSKMPPSKPASARAIVDLLRPAQRRPTCDCLRPRNAQRKCPSSSRYVSTAVPHRSEMEVESDSPPRWSQTPPLMKSPIPINLRANPPFKVNSDPNVLNAVYTRFLGPDGDKMLSEDTKWIAVTHKSFDYGRRGYNERLAYFGKRIVELQTSLLLLSTWETSKLESHPDPHGRVPFRHPAIESVECLAGSTRAWLTHPKQIASMAEQYGIPDIVRWEPKLPNNLEASGRDTVFAQVTYAIIGALALEQGTAVANRIAKARIVQPLRARSRASRITGSPR